jgi:regulator of replication initiation timing
MMRERLCRDYLLEIERLETSVRELEDEMTELRMQLQRKVDEANSLAIENASLRHKLEMMERRERAMINFLKKMKVPLVIVDEDEFEDVDISE